MEVQWEFKINDRQVLNGTVPIPDSSDKVAAIRPAVRAALLKAIKSSVLVYRDGTEGKPIDVKIDPQRP